MLLLVPDAGKLQGEMKNFALNAGSRSTLHALNVVKPGGLCLNTGFVLDAGIT